VLAGSGDGPCWTEAGGIGMFQFDAGNYDQTLAHYGHGILDVAGNIDAGIDVIIHKVRVCQHTSGQATSDQKAIDFINSATPGTPNYEAYISSMASCYNGCQPGSTNCSHQGMRTKYKAGVQDLIDKLVNFATNIFTRRDTHQDHLRVFVGEQDLPELIVRERRLLDILELHKYAHSL
jgi:hypothetical protein